MKRILRAEIDEMEKRFRANFINALSGYKSVNLVGTRSADGQANLSIVSSVIHLGSNPPLLGMVMRPPSVTRHSYENILETKEFSLNHIASPFFQQAHQTSARYDREESEFEATGLTERAVENWRAPAVDEAPIRLGMRLVEDMPIPHNGTRFIIAEIAWVEMQEDFLSQDGFVDLEAANVVTISGLDRYLKPTSLGRLNYAKTDAPTSFLSKK